MTRAPVARVRLWAARKAADRALHWAALCGAADDPYVLARLGLPTLAMRYEAKDAKARFGLLLARAAMGESAALANAERFSARERRLLAKAVAPYAPDAAARLLPENSKTAILACRLAAAEFEALRGAADGWFDREEAAISAHCAVRSGIYGWARTAINEISVKDGLAFTIDETIDDRFSIADLHSARVVQCDGPLATVIVPFHKNADTIETALRSLMAQSWINLEILAVDDRSTDGSAEIVRAMADGDPRIRLLSNNSGPGVYGARNTGIGAASGDYVTFLDADDWSPAERIERQVARLGDGAVCVANHIRMDESGAPVAPRVFPMVRMAPITMLLRRETLLAAGRFEEVATGADSEMLARLEMLRGKAAIRRDPAVLLVARWRAGSLSDAAEGGMLGSEREAYRADWMFRHAGLTPPRLPAARMPA